MITKAKTATIVYIPHVALRTVATAVTEVDDKLFALSATLEQTLLQTRNPRGVGLAGPQIAVGKRLFATQLDGSIKLYINPRIAKHSKQLVLGPKGEEPRLEGCLSIPKIYGPVPRWEWVEIEYAVVSGAKLIQKTKRLSDFPARVAQHEIDHLDGRLFIDYSLTLELPIYSENPETEELELLAPEMLIALGAQQL